MRGNLNMLLGMVICMALLSGCVGSNSNLSEEDEWSPTEFEMVNSLEGITMIVKEGTVSQSGLTVTFENSTDKRVVYSEDFLLEKNIEGKWYQVPFKKGASYGFNEPGYELNPSTVSEWTVDWDWLYGNLDTGDYRIVKGILDVRKPGDYDKHYLAGEFTID